MLQINNLHWNSHYFILFVWAFWEGCLEMIVYSRVYILKPSYIKCTCISLKSNCQRWTFRLQWQRNGIIEVFLTFNIGDSSQPRDLNFEHSLISVHCTQTTRNVGNQTQYFITQLLNLSSYFEEGLRWLCLLTNLFEFSKKICLKSKLETMFKLCQYLGDVI